MTLTEQVYQDGYSDYPAYRNPHKAQGDMWKAYDRGYWAAHDEAFEADEAEHDRGIEEAYGNFEAAADFWDDDPSPYSGTYSEM